MEAAPLANTGSKLSATLIWKRYENALVETPFFGVPGTPTSVGKTPTPVALLSGEVATDGSTLRVEPSGFEAAPPLPTTALGEVGWLRPASQAARDKVHTAAITRSRTNVC
jgi:hypothetical protein